MTSRLMLLIVMIIVSCSSDAGSQTESGKDIQNTIFAKFTADGRELPTLEEFKKTHRPHSQTNGLDTDNIFEWQIDNATGAGFSYEINIKGYWEYIK